MADQGTTWIEASLADYPRAAFQARLREELERRARMITMTGVREGFTTVTPYVTVVDVERLVAFAKEAFGAVEMFRSSGTGSAGGFHYELRIGDSMLMCGGGGSYKGPSTLAALHLFVPDVDAVFRRAIEAGAESLYEPEDKPYGERQGGVKDPTGNLWFIATHLPGAPRLENLGTVTPFLLATDALDLITFLTEALGAKEIAIHKSPEGALQHAALSIGDAVVEVGAALDLQSAFYLYVPDADALYKQAVGAGAKPLHPPSDQPYGDRMGGVEDAWGNTWYIASHLSRDDR